MKKKEEPTTITVQHESQVDVSAETASSEFIARLGTLYEELKAGTRVLKHGLITITTNTLEADLPTDMAEDKRRKLIDGPRAGTEEVFAAGPQDDLMETASRLPEHLAEHLILEHKAECDNEPGECILHDPTVAPYLGTLRAISMTFARISATGNAAAAKFLHRSLKDMGRTAVRLAEREQAKQLLGDESGELPVGMFAVEGERALRFMAAMAEAGVLPPELEEKIREQIAQTATGPELELPETSNDDNRKRTIIKNGSSTKH